MTAAEGSDWRLALAPDKQAQMGQVLCLPIRFSPESGTVEGTGGELRPPLSPRHVKCIPHGRGVDHRLICPVGGYPGGAVCSSVLSLCVTQLLQAERIKYMTAHYTTEKKADGQILDFSLIILQLCTLSMTLLTGKVRRLHYILLQ